MKKWGRRKEDSKEHRRNARYLRMLFYSMDIFLLIAYIISLFYFATYTIYIVIILTLGYIISKNWIIKIVGKSLNLTDAAVVETEEVRYLFPKHSRS